MSTFSRTACAAKRSRATGQNQAAAGISAGRARDGGAVAVHDTHIFEAGAEMFGDDLGKGRFQPLTMRGNAECCADAAIRIDTDD